MSLSPSPRLCRNQICMTEVQANMEHHAVCGYELHHANAPVH